jgi:hypothetical protein
MLKTNIIISLNRMLKQKIRIKYRLAIFLLILLLVIFCSTLIAYAHPLDITATELHVSSGNKQIEANTYIHPFLIGMLLKKNNILFNTTDDYYDHKEVIIDYLNSRLMFKNNNYDCRISSANFPPMDEFEIISWLGEIIGFKTAGGWTMNDVEGAIFKIK